MEIHPLSPLQGLTTPHHDTQNVMQGTSTNKKRSGNRKTNRNPVKTRRRIKSSTDPLILDEETPEKSKTRRTSVVFKGKTMYPKVRNTLTTLKKKGERRGSSILEQVHRLQFKIPSGQVQEKWQYKLYDVYIAVRFLFLLLTQRRFSRSFVQKMEFNIVILACL